MLRVWQSKGNYFIQVLERTSIIINTVVIMRKIRTSPWDFLTFIVECPIFNNECGEVPSRLCPWGSKALRLAVL